MKYSTKIYPLMKCSFDSICLGKYCSELTGSYTWNNVYVVEIL